MSGLPDLPDEDDVKRRQHLLIGLVIVIIVSALAYLYFTNSSQQIAARQQGSQTVDIDSPGKSNDPIQNWVIQNENKIQSYEQAQARQKKEMDDKINQLMKQMKTLKERNTALSKQVDEVSNNTMANLPALPLPSSAGLPVNKPEVLPLPAPVTGPAPVAPSSPGGVPSAQGSGKGGVNANLDLSNTLAKATGTEPKIIKVSFNTKKGAKNKHIRNTIPAGSFGRAVLLSGLDAPTGGLAERNPHPVLLELIDNGNLPNRYRHRVKQCRVVGSGTGNISDERAYIRLERLTCVLRNGEIISKVMTGTITGEDGKNGMRGNLVTKQGQLIANAFLAGSLSSIGSAVSQSYTTVATSAQGTVSTLDPSKVLQSGLSGGVGKTMEKIADWYFKRAEETYPVIEISAGRIVNLFLTEDLDLGTNLLSNYTPESIHHE